MTHSLRLHLRFLLLAGAVLATCAATARAQALDVTTLAGSSDGAAGALDGSGAAARFSGPYGVSVDSAGNLYVADAGNDAVRKVTPAGVVTTLAGQLGVPGAIDGPTATALFDFPTDTAVDALGNVYVVDAGNFAVRMIAPSGLVSTYAGFVGKSGSVDGVGTNARFSGPSGITIDPAGNLYVSDNDTIRKIAPDRTVTTLAGLSGVAGSADGQGSGARFADPGHLAVDRLGNLYVGDIATNLIRVVAPSGQVSTLAGVAGVAGSANNGLPGSLFNQPRGVAVDGSGNLFICDSGNAVIREITPSGTVSTVAGAAMDRGTADGTGPAALFGNPFGLAVDGLGNLYVADFLNNSIRKAVTGVPLIGSGVAATTAAAGMPVTLSVGAGGTMPLAYQWSVNGTPISGATSATYTTHALQLSDAGIYSVAVSNSLGSAVSEAPLTVTFSHGATFPFNGWTASSPLPTGTPYVAVAFDGSRFLAVGLDGTAYSSADGVAWNASASNGPPGQTWGELNSVINVPGQNILVAVGNGGAIVTFASGSYGGTLHASGSTAILTGIADGNGTLVAVGYAGASVHSDLSGESWAPANTNVSANLNAVAFGGGRFVAVGLGGAVVTSPDGITWTPGRLGSEVDLYGIAYGARGFVAVGNNGDIFLSPDGLSWFAQASPTSNLIVHVGYGDGVFVAVGFLGTVLTSADEGVTWTLQNSGTQSRLDGVALGSDSFVLTGSSGVVVLSAAADPARIINLSARSSIDAANILIAGFVVEGAGSKRVLMRGVGPALSQFGVGNALVEPSLTLFSGQAVVAANTSWGGGTALTQAFTQVGAFPLPANSADSAILMPVAAGAYTAQLQGLNGKVGVGLAEIYDADTGTPTARLANISARAEVGTESNILIAGFVISGNTPETVLIRGVGPSLAQFGIVSPIPTPQLVVYDSANNVLEANNGWAGSASLAAVFTQVGAFKLTAGSADAAMIVTLPPGAYTAEMSGVNAATGLGLVEIYEVR